MSSLTVEEDQKWLPTNVQVTVLRGRGLRGKGKHGTSDVYTIIQLGKEKYSTGVAEKTTEPEWREECSFELQPGALQSGGGGGGGPELQLTVMHRALIGMDVFLGQALLRLDKLFHDGRSVKNEWYRLNSKTGKKEKERGEIQVSVQFTRNNLTASMYDLVMKDKSASTFSKLKEHMKGKRRAGEKDSSSAVLPGGYGSLYRMRQRLPSDGGGEEDYEDDEGGEARRSKMRTFFLRGKLRKSSDTRSSTSLGSESSESSSRGGSLSPTAGISVVVSDLSNSPSNSSNLTADNSPEHTANTSPKSSSLQCEFGDEAGEISIAVPQRPVCVNGSHADPARPPDPGSGPPAGSLGLGLLHKSLPLSASLQNLRLQPSAAATAGGPAGDGRRWSFDKPGEEEKAAIAAALERSGPMLSEEQEEQQEEERRAASSQTSTTESESLDRKHRKNLKGAGPSEQAPPTTADKHKGWFGSKDSHSKPSLVVSPKLETPDPPPPNRPPAVAPVAPPPGVPTLHHTNPFCPSQTTPPPISPCNPFFSLLQQNPFYEHLLTSQLLQPSPPPLPFLSSSRPPIATLFPQMSEPPSARSSPAASTRRRRPLPPVPAERTPLLTRSSTPSVSTAEQKLDSDWDESFEAFAAGRLQSPEDRLPECHTGSEVDQDSAVRLQASSVSSHAVRPNALHPEALPLVLQTIPEHTHFQSSNPKPSAARSETKQGFGPARDLTSSEGRQAPCRTSSAPLGSSSPDLTSSGLGSSAEEDFLSRPSSSDETERSVRGFDESSESAVVKTPSGAEDSFSGAGDGGKGWDESSPRPSQQEPVSTRTNTADAHTVDTSDVHHTRLPPAPNCDASTHSGGENGEVAMKSSDGHFLGDSSNSSADVIPDDEFFISAASFLLTASSPHVGQRLVEVSCENAPVEDSHAALTRFADFLDAVSFPNVEDVDGSLQLMQTSSQSSSSFLHSWKGSCDRSDDQTWSKSVPDEVSSHQEGSGNTCGGRNPPDGSEDSLSGAQDLTPEASSTVASLPAALTSCSPTALGVEMQRTFSESRQSHEALLRRSQSEGALAPAFGGLLRPSMGSDSSVALPGPDPPSALPPAPPLTPPVALPTFPPLANASARLPAGVPRVSVPMPREAEQQRPPAAEQQISPHPVKPLSTATLTEEKRSVLATGLEKLKSTIHPGRSSQPSEQDADRKKSLTEGAGSYYHLTHSELVSLLVQRERDLDRQRLEFQRQSVALAKRELELRRLKPQVRDLEDYIDTLLVRIMEQKPTLLQVRSRFK